jgi:hypothetical protein
MLAASARALTAPAHGAHAGLTASIGKLVVTAA